MDEKIELEIEAIRTILKALEPLDEDVRTNVLEYVLKKLNMSIKDIIQTPPITSEVENLAAKQVDNSSPTVVGMHIRDFKESKSPKSAMEMAAIVAYYLQHLAQDNERKDVVSASDMETWFRIADYPLPNVKMLLTNAKNAGYFDSQSAGSFKLNAVGYNLVKHNLPRKGNETLTKKAKRNGKKARKK